MILRMTMWSTALIVTSLVWWEGGGADAFATPVSLARRSISRNMNLLDSFGDSLLDNLPFDPFGKQASSSEVFEPTPEGLIARAKVVLASDLGVQDESLLDVNFMWVGPNLGSTVLGKTDYLAAGRFFDLRSAFPDLDYRAHDFRIDEQDPRTVRLTARTVGTMRGELRLRNEILPPNGKQMKCPPEAISMTFEQSGKLIKLCTGFTIDRLVGNTGGVCGVMAAATTAGVPPSEWELYPATTVVSRFFGRPVPQLQDATSFLAPFPETVMIQLAKGILSADMAAADPDLLAAGFTFCGPYEGPIPKTQYLENVAKELFSGVEPELSHFRVDPYDPYRVWVDVRQEGTLANGVKLESPPQAMSFTFDDDGFCVRLTAGAVMDPSIGNTGGLGGVEGTLYASGNPLPAIATRPLPQVLSRLQKAVLSPLSKVGVDDYVLEGRVPQSKAQKPPFAQQTPPRAEPMVQKPRPSVSIEPSSSQRPSFPVTESKEPRPSFSIPRPSFSIPRPSFPLVEPKESTKSAPRPSRPIRPSFPISESKEATKSESSQRPSFSIPRATFSVIANPVKPSDAADASAEKAKKIEAAKEAVAARKKLTEDVAALAKAKAEEKEAERKAKAEAAVVAAKRRAAEAEEREAERKAKADAVATAAKRSAEEREAERKAKTEAAAIAAKRSAAEAAQLKLKASQAKAKAAAEKAQRDAEQKARIAAAAEAKKKADEAAAKAKEKADQAARARAAVLKASQEEKKIQAIKSRTIAIPQSKSKTLSIPQAKTAPRGVPSLSRWRKNRDGSITGFIQGSDLFEQGEKVTTSPIASGELSAGSIVQTESGSKYFLA